MSTLTLRFGGIALFVHRTKPGKEGIVVLMPKDSSFFSLRRHKPQRVKDEGHIEFLKGDFDWTEFLDATSPLTRVTDAAKLSTLSNGARVPTRMFDPAIPHETAARFFLPYAPLVETNTPTVRIRRSSDPDEPQYYHKVAGTVDLKYQVIKKFDLSKTLTVWPSKDEVVEIANIKSAKVQRGKYPPGKTIDHADHFFHLLHPNKKTKLVTVDPFDNTQPLASSGRFDASYVNPVECIIGTACEQGEPNCQD